MPSERLPPLPALRAFESAARLGSFVRAGDELSLSPAAVSHQIKLLEHWLGTPLFERRARGVVLNAAGTDYAANVQQAFARLLGATHSVRARRKGNTIVVRAQFSVATLWLAPLIARWCEMHPAQRVRLDALPFSTPVLRGDAELAIYHDRVDVDGLAQQVLLQGPLRMFAAPSLLRGRSALPTPAETLALPLLHLGANPRLPHHPGLRGWFHEAGIDIPATLPGAHFNLEHLAFSACLRGTGCALLSQALCADALREGALVALPGPALPNAYPYLVACRPGASDAARALLDWLLTVAGDQRRFLARHLAERPEHRDSGA